MGRNVVQTVKKICIVYRDAAVAENIVSKWLDRLRSGKSDRRFGRSTALYARQWPNRNANWKYVTRHVAWYTGCSRCISTISFQRKNYIRSSPCLLPDRNWQSHSVSCTRTVTVGSCLQRNLLYNASHQSIVRVLDWFSNVFSSKTKPLT